MAFFDNMDKKFSQFSQGANKKFKDASESVRITGAIKEEQNKQNEIYKELGQFFYENYAEQANGQLKAYCDAIANSRNIIYQYQEQLKVIKGITYCTNCNAEIPLSSAFCSACGTPVVHTAPPQPAGPSCPRCNAPVEVGQLFCVNCGSKLEQPAAEPEPAVNPNEVFVPAEDIVSEEIWVSEPQVEEVEEKAWEEVKTEPTCPECGNTLNPGQSFCTNCGTKCL